MSPRRNPPRKSSSTSMTESDKQQGKSSSVRDNKLRVARRRHRDALKRNAKLSANGADEPDITTHGKEDDDITKLAEFKNTEYCHAMKDNERRSISGYTADASGSEEGSATDDHGKVKVMESDIQNELRETEKKSGGVDGEIKGGEVDGEEKEKVVDSEDKNDVVDNENKIDNTTVAKPDQTTKFNASIYLEQDWKVTFTPQVPNPAGNDKDEFHNVDDNPKLEVPGADTAGQQHFLGGPSNTEVKITSPIQEGTDNMKEKAAVAQPAVQYKPNTEGDPVMRHIRAKLEELSLEAGYGDINPRDDPWADKYYRGVPLEVGYPAGKNAAKYNYQDAQGQDPDGGSSFASSGSSIKILCEPTHGRNSGIIVGSPKANEHGRKYVSPTVKGGISGSSEELQDAIVEVKPYAHDVKVKDNDPETTKEESKKATKSKGEAGRPKRAMPFMLDRYASKLDKTHGPLAATHDGVLVPSETGEAYVQLDNHVKLDEKKNGGTALEPARKPKGILKGAWSKQ